MTSRAGELERAVAVGIELSDADAELDATVIRNEPPLERRRITGIGEADELNGDLVAKAGTVPDIADTARVGIGGYDRNGREKAPTPRIRRQFDA